MNRFKLAVFIVLLFVPLMNFAQNNTEVEMADALRENGKIYVVVLGLAIILTGLIIFLIRIDRKIFILEKRDRKSD
jgi:hypothetical protein